MRFLSYCLADHTLALHSSIKMQWILDMECGDVVEMNTCGGRDRVSVKHQSPSRK